MDCVSLCIVWHKLSRAIYNVTHLKTSDFLTGPSIAYRYLLESTPPHLVKICVERSVDAFIRESIQGGRCFPQKGEFQSYFADAMLEAFKKQARSNNAQRFCIKCAMITWMILMLFLFIQAQ